MPDLSVIVVAWGAEPWLERGVEAALASEGVDVEVVLVDNGCTDGAVDRLEARVGVTVVRPGENLGFAGGCNLGAEHTSGEVLALVNPDAIVQPGALRALRSEVLAGSAIATGCVVLADDEASLNAAGVEVHFLGVSWAGSYGQPVAEHQERREVASASGALLALSRATWDELGGFAPELFAYLEDVDLSLRWRLRGGSVVYVPEAVATHRYEFTRNAQKLYLLDRNRLVMVLTLWERRLLALLLPALVAQELLLLPVAAAQGWLGRKLSAWGWVLRHLGWIRARRRTVQATRGPGGALAPWFVTSLAPPNLPVPAVLRPFDAVLRGYWGIVRRLLRG